MLEKLYNLKYEDKPPKGSDIWKYRCREDHCTDQGIVDFFIERYCTDGYTWSDVEIAEELIIGVESLPCLIDNDFINHTIQIDANT
jgi:hypothetical protein